MRADADHLHATIRLHFAHHRRHLAGADVEAHDSGLLLFAWHGQLSFGGGCGVACGARGTSSASASVSPVTSTDSSAGGHSASLGARPACCPCCGHEDDAAAGAGSFGRVIEMASLRGHVHPAAGNALRLGFRPCHRDAGGVAGVHLAHILVAAGKFAGPHGEEAGEPGADFAGAEHHMHAVVELHGPFAERILREFDDGKVGVRRRAVQQAVEAHGLDAARLRRTQRRLGLAGDVLRQGDHLAAGGEVGIVAPACRQRLPRHRDVHSVRPAAPGAHVVGPAEALHRFDDVGGAASSGDDGGGCRGTDLVALGFAQGAVDVQLVDLAGGQVEQAPADGREHPDHERGA